MADAPWRGVQRHRGELAGGVALEIGEADRTEAALEVRHQRHAIAVGDGEGEAVRKPARDRLGKVEDEVVGVAGGADVLEQRLALGDEGARQVAHVADFHIERLRHRRRIGLAVAARQGALGLPREQDATGDQQRHRHRADQKERDRDIEQAVRRFHQNSSGSTSICQRRWCGAFRL